KFKKDNNIIAESASQLRTTIKNLGYTEKGNELDNGGPITSTISQAVTLILKKYKVLKPDVNINVTGGNDNFHQKNSPNSKHLSGNAVDLVIVPFSTENLDALIQATEEAKKTFPELTYIDEYRKPSSKATAPHFHIQIGG